MTFKSHIIITVDTIGNLTSLNATETGHLHVTWQERMQVVSVTLAHSLLSPVRKTVRHSFLAYQ